jgi:hypothetical protein
VALGRGKDKESLAKKLGAHHYIDSDVVDPIVELQQRIAPMPVSEVLAWHSGQVIARRPPSGRRNRLRQRPVQPLQNLHPDRAGKLTLKYSAAARLDAHLELHGIRTPRSSGTRRNRGGARLRCCRSNLRPFRKPRPAPTSSKTLSVPARRPHSCLAPWMSGSI